MPKRLLLHICCGPCSIMPIRMLQADGFEVTGFFMNPNIQPLAEYLRRREGVSQCAEKLGIEIIFEDTWNIADWLNEQLPRLNSPARCQWCCASRMERTACKMKELNFDYFSTSLLYSIYQPHDFMAAKGSSLTNKFIYRDFRLYWQTGIDISKEWAIYRQAYCGCIFSENERYAKKLERLRKASSSEDN